VEILVSDLEMPEKSGFELVEAIRKREAGAGRSLPALALSAYDSTDDRSRALAAGFSEHLRKPARPDDLLKAILRIGSSRV